MNNNNNNNNDPLRRLFFRIVCSLQPVQHRESRDHARERVISRSSRRNETEARKRTKLTILRPVVVRVRFAVISGLEERGRRRTITLGCEIELCFYRERETIEKGIARN